MLCECSAFVPTGPDSDPGVLPRSLHAIFSCVGERGYAGMTIKPYRSQEFVRLTVEQQAEEALFKRNLFKQLKEVPFSRPEWCFRASSLLFTLNVMSHDYVHLTMYRHI